MRNTPRERLSLRSIWADPVWSKVISAGVIGLVLLIGSHLSYLWPAVWAWTKNAVSSAVAFLGTPASVPNWLLGLAILFALFFVFVVVVVLVAVLRPTAETTEAAGRTWRDFRAGTFNGLRWRWSYTDSGDIQGLTLFCAACDFQLRPVSAIVGGGFGLVFKCEACGYNPERFDGSINDLTDLVARKIQHLVRTDEWKAPATE